MVIEGYVSAQAIKIGGVHGVVELVEIDDQSAVVELGNLIEGLVDDVVGVVAFGAVGRAVPGIVELDYEVGLKHRQGRSLLERRRLGKGDTLCVRAGVGQELLGDHAVATQEAALIPGCFQLAQESGRLRREAGYVD